MIQIERVVNEEGCNCTTDNYDDIVFCPLHQAASDLLAALEALGSEPDGYCFCPDASSVIFVEHTGECKDAQAAIAKAKGKVKS